MADGFRLPTALSVSIPGNPGFTPVRSTVPGSVLFEAAGPKAGGLSHPGPAMLTTETAGAEVGSFRGDFYDRIYFMPRRIGIGVISGDGEIPFKVWNAYFGRAVEVSEITYNPGDGIVIAGGEPPVPFKPSEIKSWSLQYFGDFPGNINAGVEWTFDVGAYILAVSGTRSQLWPILPNWKASPYQVTYRYSTDVNAAPRTGKEQRRALRTRPRKSIEYTGTASRALFRRAKDLLWYWQAKTFVMPELTRKTSLPSGLAPQESVGRVADVPAWLTVGTPVILRHGNIMEPRQVDDITPDGKVTFASYSSQAWPPGTYLHPALTGYIDSPLPMRRQTNAVAEPGVAFDVLPLSEPVEDPGTPEHVFDGREVFLMRPNWAEKVDMQSAHPAEDVDYARGSITRFVPRAFPDEIQQATYVGRSPEQIAKIKGLFDRMRGRRGEFWMPTWEDDIPVAQGLTVGGDVLLVPDGAFRLHYEGSTVHTAIMVLPARGEPILRKIASMTSTSVSGQPMARVQVSEPWDVDVAPDDIVMVSWLLVWRFASDDLTFSWVTDTVAEVQLSLQSLEALPSEGVAS